MLRYPPEKLGIRFVDGGSTDGTLKYLEGSCYFYSDNLCLSHKKVYLLNTGLMYALGEIIVCTDVDGLTEIDCLEKIAQEFEDPKVGVVGAWVYPIMEYWLEDLYWLLTNWFRSITGHSTVGTCYAFRRKILDCDLFPQRIVADDIYISKLARSKGYKTVYSRRIKVMEIRTPLNWREFWEYRLRRWRAYWKLRDS